MPYYRNNALENLPDIGGYEPKVNHLYTAFEQTEDDLRLKKLNKMLAENSGQEYSVKFYYGSQVLSLDEEILINIAECYKDVFNESWGENWTVNSALEEIKSCLKQDISKTPVLSLLYKEDRIIGFCWAFIIDKKELAACDSPFSSSKLKRHESVEMAKYWLDEVGKYSKFITIRELGVLKEYRQDKAPYLCLPVFNKSTDYDCKVIFFRTKIESGAFKWSLGVGFVPLQFFKIDGLLLMQGSIKYAIGLLNDLLGNKKRKSQHMILSNINRYLCR